MEKLVWLQYWQRSLLVAYLLRLTPYVRLVGLNGSMVTGQMSERSDIDLFIVTKKGKIFTCRALVTVIVHLTGLRRYGYKVAGRICLNRYATEDNLEIGPANQYHIDNFYNLIPLYTGFKTYPGYIQANQWMSPKPNFAVLTDNFLTIIWRGFWELIFTPISWVSEPLLRARQLKTAALDPRVRHPKSHVVISDKELSFHLYKEIHG